MSKIRCLVVDVQSPLPESIVGEASLSISYDDLPRHIPLPEGLELVIVPLFCSAFDALEMIETLGSAGYPGKLLIIAPRLPNRQSVLRELRGQAVRQGISLDIFEQG